MIKFISNHIIFISWHKHWKGIYLHIFPKYCIRIYLWGIDWHLKIPLQQNSLKERFERIRRNVYTETTEDKQFREHLQYIQKDLNRIIHDIVIGDRINRTIQPVEWECDMVRFDEVINSPNTPDSIREKLKWHRHYYEDAANIYIT